MNVHTYDKIFKKELSRANLTGITWRFGETKKFGENRHQPWISQYDFKLKQIVIAKIGGLSKFLFTRIIRHELYHAKFEDGHEIMAIISEWLPCILRRGRTK